MVTGQGAYSRFKYESGVHRAVSYTHLDVYKRQELILYCDRGSASLSQGRELAGKGYRVKSVIGGLDSYRGCNLVKNL